MNFQIASPKPEKILLYLLGTLIFLLFFKAIVVALTYDEAYSFLYYALPRDFFGTSLANNHPLNTILMFLTTYWREDELFIRLPNLLLGCLYIALSYSLSRRATSPILTFVVLNTCPYLFEFFTLARGYGIAAGFVCLAIWLHMKQQTWKWSTPAATSALVVASLSFYPVFLLTGTFVLVSGISEWRRRNHHAYLASGTIAALGSAYPVWVMWLFSVRSTPFYGDGQSSLTDILKTGFGFATLFNPDATPVGMLTASILLLSALVGLFICRRQRILACTLVGFLAVYFGASLVAGRPLPTHRTLVPFAPLILLLVMATWNQTLAGISDRLRQLLSLILGSLLLTNFILTLRLQDTFDWRENKVNPSEVTRFHFKNGRCEYDLVTGNPAQNYYIRQYATRGLPVCDLQTGQAIRFTKQ